MKHILWAAGFIGFMVWDYTSPTAPGHDTLVVGAHYVAAKPATLLWFIPAGLAFAAWDKIHNGR